MNIWQADFYKYPLENQETNSQWQLIICDDQGQIIKEASCQQSAATYHWLMAQLEPIIKQAKPDVIQIFRPQSFNLFKLAAEALNLKIEPTRHTKELKQILKQRYATATYDPVKLEQPPPQPLPDILWGETWQFMRLKAGDFIDYFSERPIPILDIPELLKPINLGIASTVQLPGIIISGGRNSLYLARWLAEKNPVSLNYIPTEIGKSGGLVLETGLIDCWIFLTFEDVDIAKAAQQYEVQKNLSKGLHFLVIQPDNSGMTYSGVWLLKQENN